MHIAFPSAITLISLPLLNNIKNSKEEDKVFPAIRKTDIWLQVIQGFHASYYFLSSDFLTKYLIQFSDIMCYILCIDILQNKDKNSLQSQIDMICHSAFKNEIFLLLELSVLKENI